MIEKILEYQDGDKGEPWGEWRQVATCRGTDASVRDLLTDGNGRETVEIAWRHGAKVRYRLVDPPQPKVTVELDQSTVDVWAAREKGLGHTPHWSDLVDACKAVT